MEENKKKMDTLTPFKKEQFLDELSHSLNQAKTIDLQDVPDDVLDQGKRILSQKAFLTRLEQDERKHRFDQDAYIEKWLSLKKSAKTQKSYRRGIDLFLTFLSWQDSHPHLFDVSRELIKSYVLFLREKYTSRATIELYTTAVSTLYSELVDDEFLDRNPCRKMAQYLPSAKMKTYRIPTNDEIQAISYFLFRHEKPILSLAFMIIARHGLRIGILPTLHLDWQQHLLRGISKGKDVLVKTSPELLACFSIENDMPFSIYTADNLRVQLSNVFQKIHNLHLVQHVYSPHDFRHAFAIREYQRDHDIERVRKLLNHDSIETTQKYLQGLGVYS